jgi:hypothetical protein
MLIRLLALKLHSYFPPTEPWSFVPVAVDRVMSCLSCYLVEKVPNILKAYGLLMKFWSGGYYPENVVVIR